MNNTTILCYYTMNMADQVEWSYKVNFMNTPSARMECLKIHRFQCQIFKNCFALGRGPLPNPPLFSLIAKSPNI